MVWIISREAKYNTIINYFKAYGKKPPRKKEIDFNIPILAKVGYKFERETELGTNFEGYRLKNKEEIQQDRSSKYYKEH